MDKKAISAYIEARFPHASAEEKHRTLEDWLAKPQAAAGIAQDFEIRAAPLVGLRVLDAGSGSGGVSLALAAKGAMVVGIDVEEELARFAREEAASQGLSAQFVCYEGRILPFGDDSFDAAVSVSVIEHVDDPVTYFSELLRVVRLGGKLYLGFPNRLYPEETHTGIWFLSWLPRSLADRYARLWGARPLADHGLHFYSYFAVKRLFESVRVGTKRWRIKPETGRAQGVKGAIKRVLRTFGIPHRALLPHIMLILEVETI